MDNGDPLGFTKQTAMILEGLNARDLIPEFRKRNISTDALPELSKDDLMVLGATEELADKLQQQLKIRVKKIEPARDLNQEKIGKLLDTLKKGRQQLYLIDTFVLYSHRRIMESSIDFLIDQNKNERASEALVMAISSTLEDLGIVERDYWELSSFITEKSYGKLFKPIGESLLIAVAVLTCSIFAWKFCKK
ncbi:uncharacterized protein [Fopius arisanus]|uniref:Uncharacterized protein n=1 Tax=Fopius arisanus TaxID=64838 RepID=A0A9R1U0P5_9HYME|nr:PREDICTED: uncharacterized protein LOC105266935 [Fopius arisanus]XP_011303750.1 PREDICTED: uncharacterized protein LOC105266935 [Fopius arisanus]XP_011303751.1 PREDICTED: uncharacterized protein LOC105266935 [Fopius arisanus]